MRQIRDIQLITEYPYLEMKLIEYLDTFVKTTGYNVIVILATPVNAINLGRVSVDSCYRV